MVKTVMDINPILKSLENRLACRLVYHDVCYIFFHTQAVQCNRCYCNLLLRNPDFCGKQEDDKCVQHCAVKLRQLIRLKRPSLLYWRCHNHYLQLVAPIFRGDTLTGLLFAGVWQRPLPKKHIREIATLLPVLAEGLTARMESALDNAPRRVTLRSHILDILDKNYAKPLTIKYIAQQLSLSPSRASHVVKDEFRLSFSQLLRDIRLEKASSLLLASPIRVNEVGQLCGFGSVNYFSAAFYKKYGMTPRQWQQRQKKDWQP